MESKYITRCFELAKKEIGNVSPNPLVGCVIVKDGKVIGEGWHEKYGQPHAEVNAIRNSTEPVFDSTLFCNLEPCSHTNKKTPPCVPEIIKQKISKVVISNIDPNPDVNGKGVKQLREAGIEVVTGIEEDKGNELNRFYFKYAKKRLPYITLKIAQTIDGKIAEFEGKQSWITGEESGKFVHSLRGIFDAVLIGANTVIVDDPLLSVRNTVGRNPVRIILDGNLSLPETSKLLSAQEPNKTWIITQENIDRPYKTRLIEKGVELYELPLNGRNRINLNLLLQELGNKNISSILVEGGRNIFSQFIEEKLFDELIVLQSPKLFGKGLNSVELSETVEMELSETEKLGDDLKLVFRKK